MVTGWVLASHSAVKWDIMMTSQHVMISQISSCFSGNLSATSIPADLNTVCVCVCVWIIALIFSSWMYHLAAVTQTPRV